MLKRVTEMTARELIEDIANFPIVQNPEHDRFGEIKSGSHSYNEKYAAWRNQELARDWLRHNPAPRRS